MFFYWKAVDKQGNEKEGDIDARSREDVVTILKKQGYFVISIKEQKKNIKKRKKLNFFGKAKNMDKLIFTEHLATMIKAGIPLNDAFNILSEDTLNENMKKIILDMQQGLENGHAISSVLSNYKNVFSSYYINIVKAGEQSGDLDKCLRRLATHLKKDMDTRNKIKSALIYPATLMFAVLILVFILMTFVIPKIANLFAQSGIKLPLFTRILLNTGFFLNKRWPITVTVFILLIVGGILTLRTKSSKDLISKLTLKLPKFNILAKNVQLSRFSRTLSTTISSGLNITDALKLTAETLNVVYKEKVYGFVKQIEKGRDLSQILKSEPALFPGVVTGIVSVGEKTGTLDELLEGMADFYEEEVDNSIKNITALIEPALLIIMGLGIGGLTVSIITPIYQFISNV
ncbi:hypothetical protein AUK11_02480 [bacterium CG2_30_37_16]|nr:MAG: hypothetical protein AUK11_02480 [bacterium CG2_30_37_16]PIP30276.1 MAG: hypothetical protein COX25_05630 [bacterium (Candidatus Howlettbacteria) CG23_combo_of_CG06-09_8_20_14_all_37_9]PIY00108.1 MAG: hypothetical protein COZ22_01180 [bacterium (Candidatus Howlettbacteria) CG_4_10_14_3_um_filter_37_10]PJB06569.1 MAG: hypothetical protein CO123_01985 [bacterium (Candidatus Howlettbacteria) CG_4_9_14_3_um_filter_37_10]